MNPRFSGHNAKIYAHPRGTLELKYFFSSHVGTDGVARHHPQPSRTPKELIGAGESKEEPLSDNKLSELLAARGFKGGATYRLPNIEKCLVLVDRADENRCFRLFVWDEKAHSEGEVRTYLDTSKGEGMQISISRSSTRRYGCAEILCD